MTRPAAEVFEDHLRQRLAGELEADLERNYAEDVVLLTVFRARRLLDRLLHRVEDLVAVDRLLTRDRIGDLKKFEPVVPGHGRIFGHHSNVTCCAFSDWPR